VKNTVTIPMRNRVLVGALLACILAGAFIFTAFAQSETMLGVEDGDNFTYSFVVNWSSTNPNVVVPQEFSDMNQTLSIHFNVTSAAGAMANLEITTILRSGTNSTEMGYSSVSTGRYSGAPLFLIGANLTSGDQVYPQSDPAAVAAGASAQPFTINETVTRTYLGTAKTVNHYSSRETNATTGDNVNRDAYYEKSTGVLMEMVIEHYWASLGETDSEHWKITQFNSATAPATDNDNGGNANGNDNTIAGLPWWLLVTVVAVVVVVAVLLVALVMAMRKKPQTQAQTPPPAQPEVPSV
jgi:hypothetical protein